MACRLLLDARDNVSYPDGTEGGDGRLYLTHDYKRCGGGYILLSRMMEGDILVGKLATASSALHLEVSHSRPVKK